MPSNTEISNKEIMAGLLGKLNLVITGESVQNSTGETYVSYCSPGYPVTPETFKLGKLKPSERENARTFAYLVNTIPAVDGFFNLTGKTIWSVYRQVLEQTKLVSMPLTADEAKRLEGARATLTTPVEGTEAPVTRHDRYKEFAGKYQQAQLGFNASQQEALRLESQAAKDEENLELIEAWQAGMREADQRRHVLEMAMNDWIAAGYKEEIEEATAEIAFLSKRSGQSRFLELKDDLNAAMGQNDWAYTSFFPSSVLESGWTRFFFKASDFDEYKTEFNGRLSADFKAGMENLFTFKAKGNAELNYQQFEADTRNMEISFELAQLPVFRSWWDPTVFDHRGWKWRDGSTQLVSSGTGASSDLMPMYVTSVILARNLKITMDTKSDKNQRFLAQAKLEGELGLGPFKIKGIPLNIDANGQLDGNFTRTSHEMRETHDGIMVDGMQVIGFLCRKLPKSPNPDESLPWSK